MALGAAMLAAAAMPAAAQSARELNDAFRGSVPQGTATAEPLPLSFKDTLDRALQFNLGLLLQEESRKAAHGARREALADLLPNFSGLGVGAPPGHQSRSLWLPGARPHRRPIQRLRRADCRFATARRSGGAEHGPRRVARREGAGAGHSLRPRIRRAGHRQPLSRGRQRLQPHRRRPRAAGDSRRVAASGLQPQGVGARRGHRRAARRGAGAAPAPAAIVAENEFEKAKLRLGRAIGLPPGQQFASPTPFPLRRSTPCRWSKPCRTPTRTGPTTWRPRIALAAAEARAQGGLGRASARRCRLDADYGTIGQTGVRMRTRPTRWRPRCTCRSSRAAASKAARIEADAELRQQRAEYDDLRGRIDTEVRSALLDVNAAAQQVDTTQTDGRPGDAGARAGARSLRRGRVRHHRSDPRAGVAGPRVRRSHRGACTSTTSPRPRSRARSASPKKPCWRSRQE